MKLHVESLRLNLLMCPTNFKLLYSIIFMTSHQRFKCMKQKSFIDKENFALVLNSDGFIVKYINKAVLLIRSIFSPNLAVFYLFSRVSNELNGFLFKILDCIRWYTCNIMWKDKNQHAISSKQVVILIYSNICTTEVCS